MTTTTTSLDGMGARYWYAVAAKSAQGVLQRYLAGEDVRSEAEQAIELLARGPWGNGRLPAELATFSAQPVSVVPVEAPSGNPHPRQECCPNPDELHEFVKELCAWAIEQQPVLGEPVFRYALNAWAYNEARVAEWEHWLAYAGPVDEKGEERSLVKHLVVAIRHGAKLRADLCLTPASVREFYLAREKSFA